MLDKGFDLLIVGQIGTPFFMGISVQIFCRILFLKIACGKISVGICVRLFHRIISLIVDLDLPFVADHTRTKENIEMDQPFTVVWKHFTHFTPCHQTYRAAHQIIDDMRLECRNLVVKKCHQPACGGFELFDIFELS